MNNNSRSPRSSRKKKNINKINEKPENALDSLGAEQTAGLSEQWLNACIDSAGDAIYILDAETGRIRDCNARACHDLGYSKEELLELSAKDIESSLTFEEVAAAHRDLNLGEVRTVKGLHKRKDRTTFPVEIRLSSLPPLQSKLIISIVRDVSERKQAEVVLRESEYFFRESQRSAFIGSYKNDFLNDSWSSSEVLDQIFGIDRDYRKTIQGWIDIVHPDDRDVMTRYLKEKVIAAHNAFDKEYRIVRKNDGETRWVYGRGKLDFNGQGKLLSMIGTIQDITERKQAEEAQHSSQQILEGIINAIPVRVFWKDKNLVYLGCNAVFASDAGFADPQDLIGKDDYQLTWRDRAELYRSDDRQVIESGCPKYLIEEPQTTPNGDTIIILTSKIPMRDSNGEVSGIIGTYMDITERKRVENAVQESEERLKLITETIDEIFWVFDVQIWKLVYVSATHERIWGYPRQGLYENQKFLFDHIHPDDRERVAASMTLMKTGQPISHEYRIIRPDGSVRMIWDRGFPIKDENGRIKQYVGAGQDITALRQAEEKLTKSREYLNQIINCIGDPIFVKDRQHRFLLVNDATCATIGKRAEEMIGSTSVEQLSADVARSLFEEEDRVFETGNADVSVNEIISRDGHPYTFMSNKTLLTDVDGNKQIVAVLRDITDIKKAEKERSEIELQLRQAQKLEAIGRLAGGVAHDLNNMLGVIIGNAEMALSEMHPDERVYEELTEIHKAAERSANLTRQLLAFARRQTAAPKVLDLNKIISQIANMLKSLIGENISFNWRPAENLWQVKMDPSQMDQILTNLCTNARDAISNIGKITIETGNCTPNEDFCTSHPWFVPGEYVQLAVSDDGCGMDEDTLDHIFEPFFTTKGIGNGIGLGLPTVYGIVKQNNCFIDVISEPGKGTTFTIYLPRYADEARQASKGDAGKLTMGGYETILLVEDEPAILQMAKRALETKGYQVLAAITPSAAVRLAREHSGEISLLLTDVIMPEMSGQELAKHLLSLYPQMKRLFMSGYTADVISHHGVLDKGVHFIQKPFSLQDLAAKVREVLEAV